MWDSRTAHAASASRAAGCRFRVCRGGRCCCGLLRAVRTRCACCCLKWTALELVWVPLEQLVLLAVLWE